MDGLEDKQHPEGVFLTSAQRQEQIGEPSVFPAAGSPLPAYCGIVGPVESCVHFIRRALWGWLSAALNAVRTWVAAETKPSFLLVLHPRLHHLLERQPGRPQGSPKIHILCPGTLCDPRALSPLAVT